MSRRMVMSSLLVLSWLSTIDSTCPDISTIDDSPTILYDVPSTELVYSHMGHFVQMECCMTGVHKVQWRKFENQTGKWLPLDVEDESYIFINGGQTFGIKAATPFDEGVYQCVGRKDHVTYENVSRKLLLDVIPCDPLSRGPYPVAPLPCETTRTQLGSTLTLPCSGYFGCADGDIRLVMWYVSRDTGPGARDWVEANTFSPRYHMSTSFRDGSVVSSNLTISKVTSDDISRRFRCLLASPQIVEGSTSLVIRLESAINDEDTLKLLPAHTALSLVLIISAVFITSLMTLISACVIVHRIRNIQTKTAKMVHV